MFSSVLGLRSWELRNPRSAVSKLVVAGCVTPGPFPITDTETDSSTDEAGESAVDLSLISNSISGTDAAKRREAPRTASFHWDSPCGSRHGFRNLVKNSGQLDVRPWVKTSFAQPSAQVRFRKSVCFPIEDLNLQPPAQLSALFAENCTNKKLF